MINIHSRITMIFYIYLKQIIKVQDQYKSDYQQANCWKKNSWNSTLIKDFNICLVKHFQLLFHYLQLQWWKYAFDGIQYKRCKWTNKMKNLSIDWLSGKLCSTWKDEKKIVANFEILFFGSSSKTIINIMMIIILSCFFYILIIIGNSKLSFLVKIFAAQQIKFAKVYLFFHPHHHHRYHHRYQLFKGKKISVVWVYFGLIFYPRVLKWKKRSEKRSSFCL